VRRLFAVALLAGAGVFALAPAAEAHALLSSSEPAAGATLSTAPSEVTIHFTEPPEPTLSTIHVLDTSGTAYEKGKAKPVPGDARALRVALKTLPTGIYTVAWRTVSRADGHVTAGSFAFGVGATPKPGSATSGPATPRAPPTSWLEIVGRFGLFIGLLGIVGGGWVGAAAFASPPANVKRFAMLSWVAGVIGLVLLAEAQRRAAGASIGDLLATPLGQALEWRGVALAGAGAALAIAALSKRFARFWLWGMAAAGAGLAYAHVAAGHAEAASPRLFEVAVQWVHVVVASAWVGGLAALLLGIRGVVDTERFAAVRRFSTTAAFLLAIVAATGIVRALGQLHRLSDLWDTGYGVAVDAKAALIVVLAGLGAVNRYRNVPRAATSAEGLRKISRVEVSVGVVTLAVAATLASLAPPPPKALAAKSAGVVVSGADFGTSVRVRLSAVPGTAGPNRFQVRLTAFDTGKPIINAKVTLRFDYEDDPRVGEAQLVLARKGDVYQAQGLAMSLAGRWKVSVLVERGTSSLEIPLEIATPCVQTPIAGTPTIWVVDLGGGNVAQGYVDPERAGKTEVHVTFFDSKGNELPVAGAVTWHGSSGETLVNLIARRLSAGHFVADTTLAAGPWRFDFSAAGKAGQNLRGCFTETLR